MANEARAHHFVPQCWLAGFTDSGQKTGRLWVTDLKRKKQWSCSLSNEFHLKTALTEVNDSIIPALEQRYWRSLVNPSGDFIGSDNPVALDGEAGHRIGALNAEVIVFPVCRRVLLAGTLYPTETFSLTSETVARHNTFTMLSADKQVYSANPKFAWLDERGYVQTDWNLFDRDRF